MTPGPTYAERDRRAARLAAERPHAAQLLGFYRAVLNLQEAVYRESATTAWVRATGDGATAAARGVLTHASWPLLAEDFRAFAGALAPAAPASSRTAGERLVIAPARLLAEALASSARRDPLPGGLADLGLEAAPVELYCRAFLQPWAEALGRGRHEDDVAGGAATVCAACSWPAQVSVVRDEEDGRGRRVLLCALCGSGWGFPRLRCAHCGEERPEPLVLEEVEGLPHLQLETCATCRRYLKRVDLRRLGDAVPVVEDLASPELDLWAGERGFEKVCRNLLAL